jgi:hypothetical protein
MTTIGEASGWRPWRKGHDGKAAYKSAGAAEAAIRGLAAKGERARGAAFRDGARLHPYRCDVDGAPHYHIGHSGPRD